MINDYELSWDQLIGERPMTVHLTDTHPAIATAWAQSMKGVGIVRNVKLVEKTTRTREVKL